jgi:propanol-preferring alcohol dehydrogenase
LKETEAQAGQFVTIIGAAGGLGHLAIQYSKAMGMRPIAIDIGEQKLGNI